jgi:hypothetical protein
VEEQDSVHVSQEEEENSIWKLSRKKIHFQHEVEEQDWVQEEEENAIAKLSRKKIQRQHEVEEQDWVQGEQEGEVEEENAIGKLSWMKIQRQNGVEEQDSVGKEFWKMIQSLDWLSKEADENPYRRCRCWKRKKLTK